MIRIIKIGLIGFLLQLFVGTISAKDYYVIDFGAKSDGRTLNTASIQKAVDFANENGGGRVVFTPGNFLCGTIYLKSNVTLHLEAGATLLGSINPWDYIKDEYIGWTSFVFAVKQDNVGITGEGTIDGRGILTANNMINYVHRGLFNDPLKLDRVNETNRPVNVYFRECNNVTIQDVLLKDPACWNQIYDRCHNLLIERMRADCTSYWNNDGLDVVDSEDVVIRDCYINSADDAYCFKSHNKDYACKNILLENSTGRSSANGIKFGTVSRGAFKNFKIKNMTIYDTYRSAITFASVDGAEIENIEVDGLRSIHTGNVIFLRMGKRWGGDKTPYMKNITIKNVYAEVPFEKPDAGYNYEGPIEDLPRNISPASIVGLEDYRIENVSIENMEVVYPGAGNPLYAFRGLKPEDLDSIPEMRSYYPEFSQFKELPAWGFYIRHADNITFKNVKFVAKKKDYRPAIVTDDVNGLNLIDMQYVEPDSESKDQVFTYKTKNVSIE